jgi:hypothetical protein
MGVIPRLDDGDRRRAPKGNDDAVAHGAKANDRDSRSCDNGMGGRAPPAT